MIYKPNIKLGLGSQINKIECNLDQEIDIDEIKFKKKCMNLFYQIIKMCVTEFQEKNSQFLLNLEDCYEVIEKAKEIFEKEPAVLELSINGQENPEIVIIGDIHGNIEFLLKIFTKLGYPSEKRFLFLGDYVDRGSNSCEVMMLLYVLKVLYPDQIYLIRGNHEFKEMATNYGFKKECYERIKQITQIGDKKIHEGLNFFNRITDTFPYLPICSILNTKIFCVHGGITALIDTPEKLLSIEKVGAEFTSENSVQVEFMWNDPDNDLEYCYEHSPRGIGCLFNQEALESFLKTMNFSMVIRGHQMCTDGFKYPFDEDGGIMTVFSSANYCGEYNKAAAAIVNAECKEIKDIQIQQFDPNVEKNALYIVTPPDFFLSGNAPLCPCDDQPLENELLDIPIYNECY